MEEVDGIVRQGCAPLCSLEGTTVFSGTQDIPDNPAGNGLDAVIAFPLTNGAPASSAAHERVFSFQEASVKGKQAAFQTIRDWMPDERPREALLLRGSESLPLSKLLAIVLRTGRSGISAEDLARRLLGTFSSLRGIDSASVSEIRTISGIGQAKAAQIKAALEIGKRLCREEAGCLLDYSDPGWALQYVMDFYGPYLRDAAVESICLILLNGRHVPIRAMELGRGNGSGVIADPTVIVREAVRSAASYLILVHNHPSGNGEPSEDDTALTVAVRDSCALFGICLLDHIIIGRNRKDCRSLAMAGLLQAGQPRRRRTRTPPGGIVSPSVGSRDRLLSGGSDLQPQGPPAGHRPRKVSGGNHPPRRIETDPARPDRSSE